MEFVTLVDSKGNPNGKEEKISAHQNGGRLHLAFSIFVFNTKNELLLQKRAARKYHFSGLWSNTCCGHPRPYEETTQAAKRRLSEEFGFSTQLHQCFSFFYEAYDNQSGLTEKELVYIFSGRFDAVHSPNETEIDDFRWLSLTETTDAFERAPDEFTPWFRILINRLSSVLECAPHKVK